MPWRKEWLPTPVFLPGEFHGLSGKESAQAAFPSACLAAQIKRWAEGIRVPGEALYSQQKQDQELTVVQIINSLLPNSDLN